MRLIIPIVFLIYSAITLGYGAVTTSGVKYPADQEFVDAKNHGSAHINCQQISGENIECKITELGVIHDPSTHNFFIDWLNNTKQTCTITSSTYTQQFQYNVKTGNWAWNDTKPYGTCGTIEAGYFEKDKTVKNFDSWNYIEKMIFTNKTGYLCSHVHDVTNHYYGTMNPKHYNTTLQVNCKYIDFLQSAADITN
jgi:hypothetical protein